ncbi:MAG: LysR substrate-binding domain-containing protein [Castellaniella sp.]|uniref:LysR substrate-binding domain-containing protein n=1 Tax=Castellaniella sp. TaxID=1955812 RepID=UPI002A365125|nr:LysR substrate-binding domain-containing protein [Castellaniella sp.]MDY0309567.1 LysR substrate-binding domain-containing protein [Castellaniella sp.]
MAARFDLTDMQLMVNVAGAQSLTKGAERTFLSVPAASNRVKSLEESLGTDLLYRGSQGVTLTPSGEVFVKHARTVLQQLEYLRGDILEYAQGVKGRVRLYANTTATNEFLPALLGRYLAAHPDVNVELRERLSYQVVRAVAEGVADIGITAQGSGGAGVQYLPYRTDRLVLVTCEDHPLTRLASCGFEQALDYDFVSLFETSAIHSFLLKAAEDLGRVLRFRVEVGNFEAACRLIAARVGIGVIPGAAAYRYAQGMPIRIVPIEDAWSLRELHICVRESDPLPAFAQELVDLLVADAVSGSERAGLAG